MASHAIQPARDRASSHGPEESSGSGRALRIGALLVAAGLLINPSSVGQALAPDGVLDDPSKALFVRACQALAVLAGLFVLLRRPRGARGASAGPLSLALLALVAIGGYYSRQAFDVRAKIEHQSAVLSRINRSEDLLQWLTTELRELNKSALNLSLPDQRSHRLFHETVRFTDLSGEADVPHELSDGVVSIGHLNPSTEWQSAAPAAMNLWRPMLDPIDFFEHAKFYIVRGEFLDAAEDRYRTDMGFAGVARMKAGHYANVKGSFVAEWLNVTEEEDLEHKVWEITSWETKDVKLIEADRKLFVEALDWAVTDPDERASARRSRHEEIVLASLTDEGFEEPQWFSYQAHDRHPGVSVIDIDRDGFDDFYLTPMYGKNMLFRNRGDGTFEDVASELGLDYEDYTASTVFADFDNDGDADAFLGRTLARSLYLENVGGRFVDRSDQVEMPLPYFVSSVSAADYDQDGLLDVYFSTYAARTIHQELGTGPGGGLAAGKDHAQEDGTLLGDYLSDEEAREVYRRYYRVGHPVTDRAGPPNVLLRNVGGNRFERSPANESAQHWRNTYQSTWGDFDGDGDPDLYVANDFAPNLMVENLGDGTFADATAETNTADIGFGMGAAFGDYDNDGDQDLYVTNMFSKAGRRITAQIAELDPTYAQLARGNSLLQNGAGVFDKVSGLDESAVMVEKAGWSWGGQFLDVDNDGFQDIYALSGHYTAPPSVQIPVDT